MIKFNSLTDIQMFTSERLGNINSSFSRVPKYGELGLAIKLKPQAYALLCILYEFMNTVNGKCYPSQEVLLGRLMVGERSLQSYLETLEQESFIRRIRTYKTTRNGKLAYTTTEIIIVPPEYIDDTEYHKAIDMFIEENRFVVVDYDKKGRRKVVGTGKRKEPPEPVKTQNDAIIQRDSITSDKQLVIETCMCPLASEEKPVDEEVQTNVVITPQVQEADMIPYAVPKHERPSVSEEDLEKARQDFQVLKEIPGLPTDINIDKEIDSMVSMVRRYGYKPGYDGYARNKIKKMTTDVYKQPKAETILIHLKSDYIVVWNRII